MTDPLSSTPLPLENSPEILEEHPCLSCGACCTRYRVSFYWGETTDAAGGIVPAALTEPLTHFRVMMKGTGGGGCMRCVALEGEIGSRIGCSIHNVRPSVCRDFAVSWENGEPHDRCDESRKAYGLAPLKPWVVRADDCSVPVTVSKVIHQPAVGASLGFPASEHGDHGDCKN